MIDEIFLKPENRFSWEEQQHFKGQPVRNTWEWEPLRFLFSVFPSIWLWGWLWMKTNVERSGCRGGGPGAVNCVLWRLGEHFCFTCLSLGFSRSFPLFPGPIPSRLHFHFSLFVAFLIPAHTYFRFPPSSLFSFTYSLSPEAHSHYFFFFASRYSSRLIFILIWCVLLENGENRMADSNDYSFALYFSTGKDPHFWLLTKLRQDWVP